MITVRDWIATIPDTDKHVAYVGEEASVTRTFLLTGGDWQTYRDWTFYLDMAFDLSSVTTRASRQVVDTKEDTTENVSESQVKTAVSGKKETYTVESVTVDAPARTDVAYLSKQETEEGLQLTWKVLAQQTRLPGKLTATLRALGPLDQVKKSALMVFEVDPAVTAEPAAAVDRSTFEMMMDEMSSFCEIGYDQVQQTSADAQRSAQAALSAEQSAAGAEEQTLLSREQAQEAQRCAALAREEADTAESHAADARQAAQTAETCAQQSQQAASSAGGAAIEAAAAGERARESAEGAQEAARAAEDSARAAAGYADTAREQAVTVRTLADADGTRDCYINADGIPSNTANWRSYLFDVAATGALSVSAAVYSNSPTFHSISFYDTAAIDPAHFLGGVLSLGGTDKNVFTDVAVPAGTVLVVISTRRGTATDETGAVEVSALAALDGKIADLQAGTNRALSTVHDRIVDLDTAVDAIRNELTDMTDSRVFGKGNVKAIYRDVPNNNDFTVVGDEIWFAQDYDGICHLHRYRIEGGTLVAVEKNILTDFGHWNSVDYNGENDCLVFGNGGNDTATEGNFFAVVPNPRAITGSATLDTHAIRYPVNIGYKVQAVWGDPNLGKNNVVYLLADNAKTVVKVLLETDENGGFYKDPDTGEGVYTVLESADLSTGVGVGGADFWGDTLYIGNGNQYGLNALSMTDYTARVIRKQFYRDDGTAISGSTQGVHIDSDCLWLFYNVAYAQQERTYESYLVQYYR